MSRGLKHQYFQSAIGYYSLFLTAILFLLGGNSALLKLKGEENSSPLYAPLVTENTSAILRIDLQNFDSSQLNMSAIALANQFLDSAIENKEKSQKTKVAFSLMAAGYGAPFVSFFNALQESQIPEIYYVSTPNTRETSPGYLAVPVGEKKKDDLTEIRKSLLNLRQFVPFAAPFVRHGFLFAPVVPHPMAEEDYKQFVRNQFAKIQAVDYSPFENAFKEYPQSGIRFAFIKTPEMGEQFETSIQEFSEELNKNNTDQQDALKLADSFQKQLPAIVHPLSYAAVSLNQTESKWNAKLKFNQSNDASSAREAFKKVLSTIISISGNSQPPENIEETKILMKKFAVLLLPKTEDEYLTWQIDQTFWDKFQPLLIDYLKLAQKNQEQKNASENEESSTSEEENPKETVSQKN